MPMYNSIEYSYNYSKTTESWWQYYKDEPFLDANDNIADFPAESNNSGLCNKNSWQNRKWWYEKC